ncbi:MAG: T9SS type A sorting domain-containing protein [Bacteroidales bacterium]|nr:T9SS type A sorting domain-containing protein [Bacteroidales bacterium]
MRRLFIFLLFSAFFSANSGYCQDQGFFLNSWQPVSISSPAYTEVEQTTNPVTVSLKVLFGDTITKVTPYVFGDNANLWSGCMSDNEELMHHMANRKMGVLRGPAGSVSDVFFWNHSVDTRPTDIPAHLAGQTSNFEPWYGIRPYSWENWTMAVDSFYRILDQSDVTGMLTVNYGYARYGTGPTPVATAAHMAADWVRYDNGRTKFWEIGNEVFGSWEAGYRIDQSLNQDGQPEYITPSLYAQHSLVFIDSMKAAAASLGLDIKIGLVMLDSYSSEFPEWNKDVASIAGDAADFYVLHCYFTPYNQNSSRETILNSYKRAGEIKAYLYSGIDEAGKPHLPVALTEYNIFATGSKQAVSHVNGMHAVLVAGEALKTGYGAALRWDLANGWDNGNDHGMFSNGDEPGVAKYAPRPAFYHLYFMRKFTGDVMLNYTQRGDTNVVVFPTAFSSGQSALTLVNRSSKTQVARINIQDFKFGDRYYSYILRNGDTETFSRKVMVNGVGTNLVAGGPLNYESIPANASLIGDEVKIELPPVSTAFVLVESGNKELLINEEVYGTEDNASLQEVMIFPNPAKDKIRIENLPKGTTCMSIRDSFGRTVYTIEDILPGQSTVEMNILLIPGLYYVTVSGAFSPVIRKLVVE